MCTNQKEIELESRIKELELEIKELKKIAGEKNSVVNDNLFIIKSRQDRDRNFYKLMGSIVVSIAFFFLAGAYADAPKEFAYVCAVIVVVATAFMFFYLSIEVLYCFEDALQRKKRKNIHKKLEKKKDVNKTDECI